MASYSFLEYKVTKGTENQALGVSELIMRNKCWVVIEWCQSFLCFDIIVIKTAPVCLRRVKNFWNSWMVTDGLVEIIGSWIENGFWDINLWTLLQCLLNLYNQIEFFALCLAHEVTHGKLNVRHAVQKQPVLLERLSIWASELQTVIIGRQVSDKLWWLTW